MELKALKKEIWEVVEEDIYNAVREEETQAFSTVMTNDGYLEIMCDNSNDCTIDIYHDYETNRNEDFMYCKLTCKYLENWLRKQIKWDNVEYKVQKEQEEEEAFERDLERQFY